jgi:hypothetical protein
VKKEGKEKGSQQRQHCTMALCSGNLGAVSVEYSIDSDEIDSKFFAHVVQSLQHTFDKFKYQFW